MDEAERRRAHAERRAAYRLNGRTRTPAADAPAHAHAAEPSDFIFDADPAHARHVRAMQRVYREELANRLYYFERWGVPFEESELAGYRYRNGDPDR